MSKLREFIDYYTGWGIHELCDKERSFIREYVKDKDELEQRLKWENRSEASFLFSGRVAPAIVTSLGIGYFISGDFTSIKPYLTIAFGEVYRFLFDKVVMGYYLSGSNWMRKSHIFLETSRRIIDGNADEGDYETFDKHCKEAGLKTDDSIKGRYRRRGLK